MGNVIHISRPGRHPSSKLPNKPRDFQGIPVPAATKAAVQDLRIYKVGVTVRTRLTDPGKAYSAANVRQVLEPWVKISTEHWTYMVKVPMSHVDGTASKKVSKREEGVLRRRILKGVHKALYPTKIGKAARAALDSFMSDVVVAARTKVSKTNMETMARKARTFINKRRKVALGELRDVLQKNVELLSDDDVERTWKEVWVGQIMAS